MSDFYVAPETMSLAGAKLQCAEYGWREGMSWTTWGILLRLRSDFNELMHDRWFLASVIRLAEATHEELQNDREARQIVNRKKTAGEKLERGTIVHGTLTDDQKRKLILARCVRWRTKLSQPLKLFGTGNTLGITALTLVRAMEERVMTLRDIERNWIETKAVDPKILGEVMSGRRRISQRHAELIAMHWQAIPTDQSWNNASQ